MIDELRAWFDEQTAAHDFSGVALVVRDGETLFSYAGGTAHRGHGVPITEATRFSIASIGKTITAAAAFRLIDRGVLAIDQPLVELLPEEVRPTALTPAHTLGHLLAHTSGLADYFDEDDEEGWDSWYASWEVIPTYRIRRPADLLPLFRDKPAVRPPGGAHEYNNAGFVLAGLAIEAVTGRPYADVVEEEVLRPLGMADSAFDALDHDPRRLAVGYLATDEPPDRWRSNIFGLTAVGMPDGGLISTAADLARLMQALVDGPLLSAEARIAMRTPQPPLLDGPEQYGYGLILGVEDGVVRTIGHGGGDPGVSSMVTHDLPATTTALTLCNQDRGAFTAAKRLAAAFGLGEPHG